MRYLSEVPTAEGNAFVELLPHGCAVGKAERIGVEFETNCAGEVVGDQLLK